MKFLSLVLAVTFGFVIGALGDWSITDCLLLAFINVYVVNETYSAWW